MKSKGLFTRVFCALLCTIMIVGMIPVTVSAASAVALEVGNVELALDGTDVDGDYTVSVPVNVTANSGLNSLEADITYSEKLTLVGWTGGNVLTDVVNHTSTVEGDYANNPFHILFGDTNSAEGVYNDTATGTLITLNFKVAAADVAVGDALAVSIGNIVAYEQGDAVNEVIPLPTQIDAANVTATAGGITVVGPKQIVYGYADLKLAMETVNFTGDWPVMTTDYINGYQNVEFTSAVSGSGDGNRIKIDFPDVSKNAGLPYMVVGAKIPTKHVDWDINVNYGSSRTWTQTYVSGGWGTTEIQKNIFKLDSAAQYGTADITSIYINPWAQNAYSVPAGVGAQIEYVAFFATLEAAQAFTYVRDIPTMDDLENDGFAYLNAEDVWVATGSWKGTIETTEDGKTVVHYTANEARRGNSLNIKPATTGRVTSTGVNSALDYDYHVIRFKADGTTSGWDCINFRDDAGHQQWNTSRYIGRYDDYTFVTYRPSEFNGSSSNAPISNAWNNAYMQIQTYGEGATAETGSLYIESYAMFRTQAQVDAFIELYNMKAFKPDSATLYVNGIENDTFSAGEWGTVSAEVSSTRSDGLPVFSDAVLESVEIVSDNEGVLLIRADKTFKAVSAGTCNVTITATYSDGTVLSFVKNVTVNASVTPAKLISGADIDVNFGGGYKGVYDGTIDATVSTITSDKTPTNNEDNYFNLSLGNTPVGEGANKITHVKIGYEISENTTLTTRDNLNVFMSIAAVKSSRFWGFDIPYAHKADWVLDLTTLATKGGDGFAAGDYNKAVATDTYDGMRLNVFATHQLVPAGTTFAVKYIAFFTNAEDANAYRYISPEPHTVTFMVDGLEYEKVTVRDGGKLKYPATTPSFSDKVFVGWDVAEGETVTQNMTVNAVFGGPVKLIDGTDISLSYRDGVIYGVYDGVSNSTVVEFNYSPSITNNESNYFNLGLDDTPVGEGENKITHVKIGYEISDNVSLSSVDNLNVFMSIAAVGRGRFWGFDIPYAQKADWVLDLRTLAAMGGEGFSAGDYNKAVATDTYDSMRVGILAHNQTVPVGTKFAVKYIAFFTDAETANKYQYVDPERYTMTYMANGEVFKTVLIIPGAAVTHDNVGVPTAPSAEYAFTGWDVPVGTVPTGDMVINAVFKPGAALDTAYIMYGDKITIGKGLAWSYSTTDIVDKTAVINIRANEGGYWDNDGCLTLTFSGFNFPATHKYIALGIGNNIKSSATAATTHDNITFNIGGTSVLTDVNLAGDAVGYGPVSRLIDLSSVIDDTTKSITSITIDPVWRNNLGEHSSDKSGGTRVGVGATFNFTYIAAFETQAEADAFVAAYNASLSTSNVTVNCGEGGTVNTTGGAYTTGSIITLNATPNNGYVFDGWYIGLDRISDKLSYVYTVNEAVTIEARFTKQTTKAYAKLEVENAQDETLGSTVVDNSNMTGNYAQSGVQIPVSATASDIGVFGYWKRVTGASGTEVFVSLNNEIGAYALGTGVTYQPVFFAKGTTGKVVYVDATNKILSVDAAPETNPSQPGYVFNGWTVKVSNEVVTVMTPDYVRDEAPATSGLTVYAANGRTTNFTPAFNELVTVDAGADNVVWKLKIGAKSYPVSYNREFSFRYRISATSATLTATKVDTAPAAIITGLEATHNGSAAQFVGAYYLPEGATIKGYGMLLTSDANVARDMNIATEGIIVGNIAKASDPLNQLFIVKKNGASGTTWYGRPYISYTTAENTEGTVIYGDVLTATAE